MCACCTILHETMDHMLCCPEEGLVATLSEGLLHLALVSCYSLEPDLSDCCIHFCVKD